MSKKVVIIGAGHGGMQVVASLREEGFEGEIVLIASEKEMPYQKPPLSKGYLQGKQSEESILFRSANYYENNNISLRLGEQITKIKVAENQVITDSGDAISYTHLILATGANNRKLTSDGVEIPNILYLRTLADAQIIAQKLENSQSVAIIGGGFIGLELAALASEKGKKVTVIESQTRLMERVLPAVISTIFRQTHEQHGVQICLNSHIEQITAEGIQTKEGFIQADLILAGIGVIPASSLAEEAGIICENGVVVNEFQQTSVANIYAIGDCANHYNVFAGKNIRLESVQNAVDQAKVAVSHILEKPQAYRAVPWFWTNQYHLKLQMVGISAGFDEYVVRGESGSDKFSVYYFKNKQLIAVDSLNRAADHLNARKLITAGINPTKTQLEDLAYNLNSLL